MGKPIPQCFESRRQYELWLEVARRSNPGDSGYCTDCTVAYKRQMMAQARCAYPNTTFHDIGFGVIEGHRAAKDRIQQREGA